jgi:CRISPR-associated protein Cas2
VPLSLRGELTKWLIQLKPGVFIGTISAMVGEKLWKKIQEKLKDGGVIWVKATNNEQRFRLMKSGNTNWQISDFDGLQLITHPHKRQLTRDYGIKKEISQSRKEKTSRSSRVKQKPELLKVTWDAGTTPENFIIRKAKFKIHDSQVNSLFSGNSAYGEYPPETLWQQPWQDDLSNIATALLTYLFSLEDISKLPFYNKKILCLDIETTDYLPKAYEGFINIIGISILNLREEKMKSDNVSLKFFQAFNMMRKKADVPTLINLGKPYFKDIDILLVFNKDFDIRIINTVSQEFSLDVKFPLAIIDLMKYYPSLRALEEYLSTQFNIQRKTTDKNKYSEYYSLFKGTGRIGLNKQIEPIGTYNLTDTLTPLFAYLSLNSIVKK